MRKVLQAAANPAAAETATATGAVAGAFSTLSATAEAAETAAMPAEDTAVVVFAKADFSAGGEDVFAFFFFFKRPGKCGLAALSTEGWHMTYQQQQHS